MSRRKELKVKRDNEVHWMLVNWIAFVRYHMPGPKSEPHSASWQAQIVNPGQSIDKAETYFIDEDAATTTQQALNKCREHDHYSYVVLIKRYRDGVYMPGLGRARHLLWRWL